MHKPVSRSRTTATGSSTHSNRTARATHATVVRTKAAPPGPVRTPEIDQEKTRAARQTLRTLPESFQDERDDVLGVINELEDQLDRHEQIRESLERELTDSQQHLQGARQKAQELEWQVVTLQTRIDMFEQTRQEIATLEAELAEANQRAGRAAEQVTQIQHEVARVTAELKTANQQLEELWALKKERDGLRTDLKNLRGRIELIERNNRELAEERTALDGRLQQAIGELDEQREARNQLEIELRAAEDGQVELRRIHQTLEQKIEAQRADKKALQVQLTKTERENTRLLEQQQYLERELNSLRNMNRTAESALTNVKKAFAEVRVALSETKARARRRTNEAWPPRAGDGDGEPELPQSATGNGARRTTAGAR